MNNPLHTPNHTAGDLKEYAFYRKNQFLISILKAFDVLAKDGELGEDEISLLWVEGPLTFHQAKENGGNQLCHALGVFREGEKDKTIFDLDEAYKFTHYMMSTGGDGDGFIVSYSRDKFLNYGVYYWEDWGVREFVPFTQSELKIVRKAIELNVFSQY